MVYAIIFGIGIIITTAIVFHGIGYVRGYRDGLAYGTKGLDEYHKHVMRSIDRVSNYARRRDGNVSSP